MLTLINQIPYIVLEAPSNLLMKRFSPSKWQSRIMLSWGIALMCNAAVKNKGGLYTTRFLLGVVRRFTKLRGAAYAPGRNFNDLHY